MEEEWRPVVGWEGLYEVSSLGRVRSVTRLIEVAAGRRLGCYRKKWQGRVLRPGTNAEGYLYVHLSGLGHSREARVHVLVCEAFHGLRPLGHVAAHNDGKSLNNNASNLRWDTPAGNMADTALHGTKNAGERHSQAKLSAAQVQAVRLSIESCSTLACHYGVSRSHISRLRSGRRRNVPGYP